jgi:hypothetical protein
MKTLGPFAQAAERFSEYLPTLAAGLLVIALGLVVGWIVKRAVVRVLIWLRLDRLGGRFGWRAAFGKGDVRAALYNLIGSGAMLLVALVFLDNALQILGLTVLSRMIDRVVFYLPNLILVLVIVGLGVMLANGVGDRVENALEEEEFARARLVGRFTKSVLLCLVGAIGLWQLNLARQVVLVALAVGGGAVGVALALALGLGSVKPIQRAWEALLEKKEERR